MNPLQKKCVIATAGCHLLLLVILFIGPGFFTRTPPPPDELPTLKMIPVDAIESALPTASARATPQVTKPVTPPPQANPPPEPKPEPPAPKPEPPKPEPKPEVAPEPAPHPKPAPDPKPVKTPEPDEPDQTKPTEEPDPVVKPPTKPPHRVVVDLTPHEVKQVKKPKPDHSKEAAEAAEAEAQAQAEARAAAKAARRRALAMKALNQLNESLRDGLTSRTEVDNPKESGESKVNYGQIVKNMYENAWNPPDSADNDEASPKVHVVIARDGTVIEAHIIEPSGDKALDDSVQRTLDRVRFIRPFAEGATEEKRSYNISFNLKAKRMLG